METFPNPLTKERGGDIIIKLSNERERSRKIFFSQKVLTRERRSDIIDERSKEARERRYLEN